MVYHSNYHASEQAVREALKLNPSNTLALQMLSVYQNTESSVKTLKQAIKLDPMDLDFKNWLIYAYLQLNENERAIELLNDIKSVNKHSHMNALIAHRIYYGREKNINKALSAMQQPEIQHNRLSEYLLAELYLVNGDIDSATSLIKENINRYPHDERLAKLISQFLLIEQEQLFTSQQQVDVTSMKELLSDKLQNIVDLDFNLLTGKYQAVLANENLYQQLLIDADNLTAMTGYKEEVLISASYLFSQHKKWQLLNKVNQATKHLIPWCKMRTVSRNGCTEILYYNGEITDKSQILSLIRQSLTNGFTIRDKYLATDARYLMIQDMPEFQLFAKAYVNKHFSFKD